MRRGFYHYAGAGPELFPGGPAFVGGSDQGVFYGTDTGFTAGAKNQGYTWVPADSSLRTKAANKWAELSDPNISEKDLAWKQAMQRKLDTLLNSFYQAVGNHSIMGYSADATQQIIYVGDQLKAALRQLVAYRVTPTVLEQSVAASTTAPAAPDSAMPVNQSSAIYPSTTSGAMTVAGDEDNTRTYVFLGIGALALVGGLLLMRRKSSGSMSGYRRRRRRR